MSGLLNAGKNDRNAPSFKDAVNDVEEVEKESVDETNVDSIQNVVDSITQAPKEAPKKQISVYLDADVAKAFDKFGNRNGKGSKSTLINNFLKKALINK